MPSEKGAIISLFERLGEWEQAGEISPLAKHHAQSLLIDFIRLQTQVSQRLAQSKTFVEIADSLANGVVASGQFFSINLFSLDPTGTIEGMTCVAMANRHKSYEINFFMDIPASKMGDLYQPIFEDGKPVYIADTTKTPFLRVEFNGNTIESYILFPMRSQGRTIGIINLNSVQGPIEPTPFQMEWYQSLIDIATSQVELHNLIAETTTSHDLSERQAQVFNQLIAGQEYGDMAQVIAHYLLPQKGRSLAIMELVYNGAKVSHWVVKAVANRNQLLEWDFERELRWQDLGKRVQSDMLDGETVIIDDSDIMTKEMVGEYFFEWLKLREVNSLFSVTISNGKMPTGVIVVMSRTKRAFNKEEINAFQNVSELVGALSEVRILNETTAKSQQIINELLLANRLVTTAQSFAYMAQAVIYTLGKNFIAATITLFDKGLHVDEVPNAHYSVAFATSITAVDSSPTPIPVPNGASINRLLSGFPDIREEENTAEIQQTFNLPAEVWVGAFGLRVGDELFGTLSLFSTSEYVFSEEELNAYSAVADQIGMTIRGRQLLEETRTAQQFATRLTQANQAIVVADDYPEMARLLIELLPPQIKVLALIFFDKALMAGDVPKLTTLRVAAMRDTVLTPDIVDDIADVERPERYKDLVDLFLRGEGANIADLRPPYPTLIKNIANFFVEKGVYSAYNIGLRVGTRVLGVLSLGKEFGYEITELQRNNVVAIADQLALTIENRRLLSDTKITAESLSTQVRALRIINELSATLGSLQDESAVMDKTVRALVDALNVDHAGVTLLTDGGDKAVVVSEYPKFGTLGLTFSAKDDEFQRKLRNQTQPIIVNNIETSGEISSETRDLLRKTNIKSIAILPLIDVRAGFIGSVGLDLYDEKHIFTSTMVDFARTITSQMAVTIQNIRLLQNTRRQARQMEAIAGFSQSLQAVLDIKELFYVALQNTQQVLSADRMMVLLFNATSNQWHRIASADGARVTVNMDDETLVPLDYTTGGQVIKTQRMFSGNDLGKSDYKFTFDETMNSAISLPLMVRGVHVGVVEIGNHKSNAYTNTDSAIFQQLVSQMGIGLENAETYSQSQRLAKSKALVNDISSQLQQQSDIDQILSVTLNELGKAIGAKRARIRLMTGDDN
ncbi:MAG: GAF domain-containing protein [bacterium]|nr:GAF domain-containing protein [bacterium]